MWESFKKWFVFKAGSFIVNTISLCREKKLFELECKHGFNVHFDTSCEKLSAALPELYTPNPIRIMEDDENPRYLVSMYVAETQLRGTNGSFGRGDVFTYVIDSTGKKSLFFLGSIQQDPPFRGLVRKVYNILMEYFRMDPLEGYATAYPHTQARDIVVGKDSFSVTSSEGDEVIYMSAGEKLGTGVFHRDFIVSNSRVYRGHKGTRNVTFFNDDFMDARVTRWDASRVVAIRSQALHPACGDVVLVESYGDDVSPLSWYVETL